MTRPGQQSLKIFSFYLFMEMCTNLALIFPLSVFKFFEVSILNVVVQGPLVTDLLAADVTNEG